MAILILLLAQDVDGLIEKLADPDAKVREGAESELLKLGTSALPKLDQAAVAWPEKFRAPASAMAFRIRWADCAIPAPADDEVKELLRKALASGEMSGEGGLPLETAFSEPAKGLPTEAQKLPWADSVLDVTPFTPVYRTTTLDGKLGLWRARAGGRTVQVVSGDRSPRFIVVTGKFDLAKATWSDKEHAIPALSELGKGTAWSGLYLDTRVAGKGYVHFTFHWAQDKPFPNVRHVIVTESFVVFGIGYQ